MKNKSHNKKTNSIKSTKSNKINFERSKESEIENGCRFCKQLTEENKDLKEQLKELNDVVRTKSILQSADKIKDLEIKICEERFGELREAMSKSKCITLVFHGLDTVGSIQSDNAKEKHQNKDTSFPNNSSDTNTESNDSDT